MNSSPVAGQTVERLPFRVRIASGSQDLAKVVEIRAKAYARHLPTYAPKLREPEAEDHRDDAILLLAERKVDGAPIGSSRLLPNLGRPLSSETDAMLPDHLRQLRLLESSRLGVAEGEPGRLVTAALSKATYIVCRAMDINFGIAVARRSTVEFFRRMGYDIAAGPFRFEGVSVPLWMVAMPTAEFESRLHRFAHPFHRFVSGIHHPDIAVAVESALPVPVAV